MYVPGELIVGGVLLASAYSMVYIFDFNNRVVNKPKRRVMISKVKLKECWNQFLIARELQSAIPTHDDTSLNDFEFALLCHIAHQDGNVNITSITKHPYFSVTSLSTVKRAVVRLISKGVIRRVDTSNDKREHMLSIVKSNGEN
jgi:DNA-binding MarR family transcriptional regulator